jgi:predicted nuclease of predicted toxin-antitoxin system
LIRFLSDDDIYPSIVQVLRDLGHDVFDIKEEKLTGIIDDQVYDLAKSQNRILVSMDKDFTNILLYPLGDHSGIIVAKFYRMKIDETAQKFLNAFVKLTEDDIKGNLVIIDKNKTRIRRAIA